VAVTGARENNRETDGGEHEDDRRVGRELGEQIGRAAGTESGLRTGTTESAGEVGGLALLQQNYTDEEEANDNVQDNEKNEHVAFGLLSRCRARRRNLQICAAF
jgi:hypothetical protein